MGAGLNRSYPKPLLPSPLHFVVSSSHLEPHPNQPTIHPRPHEPSPNIPQPLHLNHPLPAPTLLPLEKRTDTIHRIGEHAPRQLPRPVMPVVLDRDDRPAVSPRDEVGEDEAVAVVGEGGVVD